MMSDAILLVEDDDAFRESTAFWLESLGHAVRAFPHAQSCLEWLQDGPPACACLVLDVRLPDMSGIELMETLRAAGVTAPVIFVTGHGDVALAVEAMQRGALTFLEKPFADGAIEAALDRAFKRGEAVSAPRRHDALGAYAERLSRLTPREREVMELLVAGCVNKVVAHKLGISHKTVELHRSRIMAKMEARSLPHLLRMALTGDTNLVN